MRAIGPTGTSRPNVAAGGATPEAIRQVQGTIVKAAERISISGKSASAHNALRP